MEVSFGEQKCINSFSIKADPGHFALDEKPLVWENCRERFHKSFTNTLHGFYYKHLDNQSKDIASFILKTEEVLKLKDFSKFCQTNIISIIWVEPSEFWKSCAMRRSLFTVFLRCALNYSHDQKNYEEALFLDQTSSVYALQTKNSIMRFLFGFTKYVGPSIDTEASIQFRGWRSEFEHKNITEIKSMLVYPDQFYIPKAHLASELWT